MPGLRRRDVSRTFRRNSNREMNFKLDENLGNQVAEILRAAGHDVRTVPDQNMCSASDTDVIEACRRENRCLLALDLEFANPLLFKPSSFTGIAVVRVPSKVSPNDLTNAIQTLVE